MRRSSEQFGWFHITDRGVDRQDIFIDDADRAAFCERMVEAAERFGIEIHAFCLMSNHFHLLVHCPNGGVSDFMQRLLKRYVDYHNRRVDRIGHLFSGRFRSTVIDEESGEADFGDASDAFQVAARYVHRNQLDRLTLQASRFDRFSSYGMYAGTVATPDWLHTGRLLGLHGDDPGRLVEFTERQHLSDKTPGRNRTVEPFSADEVVAAVAESSGIPSAEVVAGAQGRTNEWRDLAAHLCSSLRTGTAAELRLVFGLHSQSAFRRLAARGKDRCGADPRYDQARARAIEQLWSTHLAEQGDLAA